MWFLPVINKVVGKVANVVDKMVVDKDLREKLKHELSLIIHQEFIAELQARKEIIVAEITGHSWLQRNWRPLAMLLFLVIILNNYILYPYLKLFFAQAPKMEVPSEMWDLLKLGMTGYIVGRTAEKIALRRKKDE